MRRLIVVLTVLGSLVVAIPADAGGGGGCHGNAVTAASTAVDIQANCFTPTVAEVAVGDDVTWTNRDMIVHNVVAVGGAWRSDELGSDAQFTHSFGAPGTYVYVCTFHPGMAGAVNVVEVEEAQSIAAVTPPSAENGDGPGLAGAVVVIFVLVATTGAAARLLLRRPSLG